MNSFSKISCLVLGFFTWMFSIYWSVSIGHYRALSGNEMYSMFLLTVISCFLLLLPSMMEVLKRNRIARKIEELKAAKKTSDEVTVEYLPPPPKQGDRAAFWQEKTWPKQKP